MIRASRHPKQKAFTLALAAALASIASPAVKAGACYTTNGSTTDITNCTVGVSVGGSYGTVTNNAGTIHGSGIAGLYVNPTSTISVIANSGTITGSQYGIEIDKTNISPVSTVGTLTNSGTLSGPDAGVFSNGVIGTLTNSGTIGGTGSTKGILNFIDGTIASLNNNSGGLIRGGSTGIVNNGAIGVLSNNGTILAGQYGYAIYNSLGGSITTLNNGGNISAGASGIDNGGSIGTLTNSGTISGGDYALRNESGATLGPIANSGVIAGVIRNEASQNLTINGGSGATFGTLTGYTNGSIGGIGTITNTASSVVFGSGNLLLNDNINVGSNAVNNTGATLQVNAPMSITGNYNQGASATLLSGVNSAAVTNGVLADTGYGRLVVSGSATIAAGAAVGLKSLGYAFAPGQRFVVVDASSSGTNYNEGSLRYSASGFAGSITGQNVTADGRSDLVLTLGALSPSSPATGPATIPNSIAALAGLSNYTGISPALLNLFNAGQALNLGSSAEANRAGAQLSPVQHVSATDAAAAPIFDVLKLVSYRNDSLRLAQADGGNGSGIATGEGTLDSAVWAQPFGGHASQNMRGQVDGYGANYGGLLIGGDTAVSERWRAGAVFSYSNTLVTGRDNSSGDSTRVNAYGLTGYASYIGQTWYANLLAGVVGQKYDTRRSISFTGFSGVADGKFNGQQYVARAEGGYPLAVGSTTVTPLASLTYSRLHQNGYTESGGNGAALAVDAAHATSVRSSLGVKIEQGFETGFGKLVPEVQLQWLHEFNHDRVVTGASYAADPTGQTVFSTVGATPVRDLADLALGVTLLRANNLSVMLRYELQLAPGFVSQTGSLRLRQLF